MRRAVVLFNLGGPDRPAAIRPFLLNLFRDPAILRVPFFLRPFLARWIVRRRIKPATASYALLGGCTPLLATTMDQATALENILGTETKCFVAMRYWHPLSEATARAVRDYQPDEIILLPLYPHYSTTTTGSSLTAWREAAARVGLVARTTTLCCYPDDPAYITAMAALLQDSLDRARQTFPTGIKTRILFSAHGLPESIINRGDPYQNQIERSVAAILTVVDEPMESVICYQSRATPQKWIGPSIEEEIKRAAQDHVGIVVVPISFVSDHVETLVELDREYREMAVKEGIPAFIRVAAPNNFPPFISALAALVNAVQAAGPGLCTAHLATQCARTHQHCPHHLATMS